MVEAGRVCEPRFPGWLGPRSPCVAGVPKGARGITLQKGMTPMSACGKQQLQQLGRNFLGGCGHCEWETLELGVGSALGHGAHTYLGAGPLAVGCGAWFSQNTRDAAGTAGLRNSHQLFPPGLIPSPRDYGSGLFNALISAALGLLCLQL